MDVATITQPTRRPRFRRASEPPAFRLTDDDLAILRHLARHRFLRSTHIAALVGRSVDAVNGRLKGLFHHGYVDRPRAQLDFYPTGSAPMAYALAGRGARHLIERDGIDFANVDWSRKNRRAGRPFIEHQLAIVDFYVAMQIAMRTRDERLVHPDELVAAFPDQTFNTGNPFALRAKVPIQGVLQEIGVVSDLAFGLVLPGGSRRTFMVENGTMPVVRTNFLQSSFERKMRAYLTAHAAKAHEQRFGWNTFRVLTVTTDERRLHSMQEALRELHVAHSPGTSLFFFTTRDELRTPDALVHARRDGSGRDVQLVEIIRSGELKCDN